MKKIISREKYLNKISPFIDKELIKVIIGQRRSGKSMILMNIIDTINQMYGKKDGKAKSIISINKESLERDHIKNYKDLYEAVKDYHYILVDEIQDIVEREKAIRSLHAEGGHDIYITGSNLHLLSGELSTYLSGRYVQTQIYPLDYKEFLQFHNLPNEKKSFTTYMEYGGMPQLMELGLEPYSIQYLHDVYDTIVLKDIVKRFKIRNVSFFQQLMIFLAKNLGSIFSTLNISNFLGEQGVDIQPNVINEYLSFAQTAMILHGASRYDIKSKKLFERKQKYFFSDTGLRHSLVGYGTRERGRILENIVYTNLISNGRDVCIGEIGDYEIDFVASKADKKMYIQVAYLLESEHTIEREYRPLLEVTDGRPRYIVSLDDDVRGVYEGIMHKSVVDFVRDLSIL